LHGLIFFAFIFALLPTGVSRAWAAFAPGDIIEFGSYPQTLVTDPPLLADLNKLSPGEYGTVMLEGEKYKLVNFAQYTPYYYSLAPTAENSYQDDNGYFADTSYWFKFEPVEWRVLSAGNGQLLLMSEKILNAVEYNFGNEAVTWETSSLRGWLNNAFYSEAFSFTEKARIETTEVVNQNHPVYGTPGGNNTLDKVFLLSYNEALNPAYGFDTSAANADPARQARGTDFAKCMGLYVYPSAPCTGNSGWWFRSPGFKANHASHGNGYGHIYEFYFALKSFVGVRPVITVELPGIRSIEGSGCVVDETGRFIYGLRESVTKTDIASDYVETTGGAVLRFAPGGESAGTGTAVEVLDGASNGLLATYHTVIFGDVNGDGLINAVDADLCNLVQDWLLEWDAQAQAYNYKAGDVNGDGRVDSVDADIIAASSNWTIGINQTTGLAGLRR